MEKNITIFSNGEALEGYMRTPDTHERHPCIILCHGHSRYCNDGLDVLAERLASHGFASLRFNFRGCGRKARNRYRLYCATDWPEDLCSAISFAESLPCLDSDRIGVAGISMGASTAVHTAGKDSRIKAVVAMAGVADCSKWLEDLWKRKNGDWPSFIRKLWRDRIFNSKTGVSQIVHVLDMYNESEEGEYELNREAQLFPDINDCLTLDSLDNLLRYKPLEQCPNIKCPILFQHGDMDILVPQSNSSAMYEATASRDKQLKIYPKEKATSIILHRRPTQTAV